MSSTGPFSPSKLPLHMWGFGPPSNTFPWAHLSTRRKWHLNKLSQFCRAHNCDRLTDRQMDHANPFVAIGHIWLVVQCSLIIGLASLPSGVIVRDPVSHSIGNGILPLKNLVPVTFWNKNATGCPSVTWKLCVHVCSCL